VLVQHKPSFRFRDEAVADAHAGFGDPSGVRFSVPSSDPRLHALVVALDDGDFSIATTWRAVGEAAQELGLRRPSYYTVRELVRAERARKEARARVRAAGLGVLTAAASWHVVDLPVAVDAFAAAQAKKKLVLEQHKPS
jgi:hypothetical protein